MMYHIVLMIREVIQSQLDFAQALESRTTDGGARLLAPLPK
jgi:hypothetical protein